MKNNFTLLLLTVLVILFQSCNLKTNHSHSSQPFSIHLEDNMVKIQDSTTVILNMAAPNDSSLVINWSTNNGTIKGQGAHVRYIAPDSKGWAIINAEISDNTHKTYKDSIKIMIYKQLVILKADDVVFDENTIIPTRWKTFIDYIAHKNIKAGLGIIGNSLDKGNTAYFAYLKDLAAHDSFELWNHGYSHLLNGIDVNGEKFHEFWKASYADQKEHLLKTQDLAKEKLGITLHTFGAPGNAMDDNTLKVLEERDTIKVLFFGSDNFSKLNLKRFSSIEYPTHNPDFQKFQLNYDAEKPYQVLQGHPNSWDEQRFMEFTKIIDFLIQNEVTFINPYEYYQLIN